MVYAPHYRVTMSGKLGGIAGPEEFSYGLCVDNLGDGFGNDTADLAADIIDDCQAFHSRATSYIWSGAVLRLVKVAAIGTDGKYVGEPFIAEVNTPGGIQAVDPLNPFQTSWCVSLETARRGPSGKGRFYLPAPMVDTKATGLVGVTEQEALRGSVVTFLNAINNSPGFDGDGASVAVASSKGFNSVVTGVRIGRVLDVVRTRRRSLVETYGATAPLA